MKYFVVEFTVNPVIEKEAGMVIREFIENIGQQESVAQLYLSFYESNNKFNYKHVMGFKMNKRFYWIEIVNIVLNLLQNFTLSMWKNLWLML